MFSVIPYMLRQTDDNRAPLLLFPYIFPSYCDVSRALSYFASTIRNKNLQHTKRKIATKFWKKKSTGSVQTVPPGQPGRVYPLSDGNELVTSLQNGRSVEQGGDDIKEFKEDEVKGGRRGGVAAPAMKTGLCTAQSFISGKCEFRLRTPPCAAREDCLQEWVLLK
jgi:hypothetical protein